MLGQKLGFPQNFALSFAKLELGAPCLIGIQEVKTEIPCHLLSEWDI